MALKICKECQKEYSDTLKTCPHCGYQENNTVVIYGYTEAFALNPSVEIFHGKSMLTTVPRNGKVELGITGQCELTFKCNLRTCKCVVNPGDAVVLSFNRVTGGLSATTTDQNSSATVISSKKGKDSNNIVLIISAVIGMLIISLMIS